LFTAEDRYLRLASLPFNHMVSFYFVMCLQSNPQFEVFIYIKTFVY